MALKILICDDAGFVREILSQAIADLGHIVVGEARDGMEVVRKSMALNPDLILMDLVLPLKNGAEAAREIRDQNPSVKIVALSTTDESLLQAKAQQSGCDAWMTKPFTKLQLKALLDSFQTGRGQGEIING